MDKQSISSTLKREIPRIDNKEAFRIAGVFWGEITRYANTKKKEAVETQSKQKAEGECDNSEYRMTPEERAQVLADLLDKKLKTGEILASELRELKDIFNLKAKDQDISIEQVDYSDIDPETFDIIQCVGESIRRSNATGNTSS